MGYPVQGYPQVFHQASLTVCLHPFILLGGGRHHEGMFSLEHNTMTWPVLEPRAINLECSGLTIRPQHLPLGEPWVTFYTLAPSAAPFATPNYIRSCSISYVACKNSPSYYSLLQLSISILHVHLRTRWLNDNFFASF